MRLGNGFGSHNCRFEEFKLVKQTSTIVTVTGEIAVDNLGQTLAHEHLWCDISVQSRRQDNVLHDASLMVDELKYFRKVGGSAIVEVTPEDLGRNGRKLKEISEVSGVQIVSGIAFTMKASIPHGYGKRRWSRLRTTLCFTLKRELKMFALA